MSRRATTTRMTVAGTMVAAALFASSAFAGPGDHIQVSDTTEITPSVAAGVEFRSNSYLAVGAVQSAKPVDQAIPSVNFILRPKFKISHESAKANFSFDGVYELRKWFNPELAANLDRFSDFTVDTRLDLFPKGTVGFRIGDGAVLKNRESDNQWRGNALLTQFRNDLATSIVVRPGPDFDVEAGFGWGWHNYRVPGADEQRPLNTRNTFAPSLNVHWRFFPNTAFVVETTYQRNAWTTNWIPTNETTGPSDVGIGAVRSYGEFLAKPDSDFFKAMTGIRGRVTREFVLHAMVGWGLGRYSQKSVAEESASNPGIGAEADPVRAGFDANVKGSDGLLVMLRAQVDLGFSAERRFGQAIDVMYRKDFQDSFFTNYVHQHHVRGGLQSRWGRYLSTNVGFGPRFEEYHGEVARRDIFLRFDYALKITPTRYLSIDFGGYWAERASSQTDIQYDNFQASGLLTFTY